MSSGKRKRTQERADRLSAGDPPPEGEIHTSGWSDSKSKVRWKAFAGPPGILEPVRVNVSRQAYADLVAHAKEKLDVEVCGVLIGGLCEDEEGDHVSVEAIIRGEAAKQGGAHVTFTQETWNRIHERREKDHPGRDIVGWYHTRPGFGVTFSEMDLFIQRNFFAGRSQIALVTDPLGGAEAMCVNRSDGIEHVSRFWVDGRERRCLTPDGGTAPGATVPGIDTGSRDDSLRTLEDRLGQVIRAIDEQRASQQRFLLTLGMVAGLAIVGWLGYGIYARMTDQWRPPKTVRFADIPVRVGDDTYLLGVEVVKWRMPDHMASAFEQAVMQAVHAREEARKKKEDQALKESAARKNGQGDKTSDDGAAAVSPKRDDRGAETRAGSDQE